MTIARRPGEMMRRDASGAEGALHTAQIGPDESVDVGVHRLQVRGAPAHLRKGLAACCRARDMVGSEKCMRGGVRGWEGGGRRAGLHQIGARRCMCLDTKADVVVPVLVFLGWGVCQTRSAGGPGGSTHSWLMTLAAV